ncbi:DEK domain-containing chromatin-associated protein 1-like [Argentina anserina]|uniref:DEK domain-containing chromatin-associated protein 1-like n=1 Tax=Argentina anserina TaxID=57926 RepID=UPI002176399D|nr:DEK domain-containing chromatin-associated protein 1-like [Potentilla anserina]
MASEALEEKKPEEEAPVEDKHEIEAREEAGEEEEREELPEVSEKATENEGEVAEEGEESQETPKKGKRGRKASSESQTESKKRGGDSAEKKKLKKEGEVEKKEPVTPVSERPTRERKVVERYSAPETGRSSATKPLSIEKGPGTQLKDIPNVAFKLSKRKPDDNLQLLHTILFGKKAKSHALKRNIVQFSGYVWAENEQEKQRTRVKEKLDKCVKEKLMDFCDVLNIQINKAGTKKEELSVKLLEFLESPHATTDVLLAEKEKEQKGQKRKKKVTPSKTAGSGDGSPETPAKKQKDTSSAQKNEETTKDEEDVLDDKVEPSDSKDDLEGDDDEKMNEENDHGDKSDEDEDDLKGQVASPKRSSKDVKESSRAKTGGKSTPAKKKTTPKSVKTTTDSEKKPRSSKRGATDVDGASGSKAKGSVKKQKNEKESPKDSKTKSTSKKQSSKSPAKVPAKDQVKGKTSKKAKAEPTKEDVHAVIVDILKEVDFNTATLSDILKQLGTHFGIDLMHRKAEVKDIITDVINNMTDEDEDEAAGDDSEKEDHDA